MKKTSLSNLTLNDQSTELEVFQFTWSCCRKLNEKICQFWFLATATDGLKIPGTSRGNKEHEKVSSNIKSHRAGDFMDNGIVITYFWRMNFYWRFFSLLKSLNCVAKNFLRFSPKKQEKPKREIKLTTNKIMRTNSSGLFASFKTCEIKH